jgi:mRNA-degrading endonuclease toxin of MazEF toxin-antitoxin module
MVKLAFGEVVLASGGTYSSKPRPVLVFQDPDIYTGESVIVIPFTTSSNPDIITRVSVKPTEKNGLDRNCFLEVDKLSAVNVACIGGHIGILERAALDEAASIARKLLQFS